MKYPKQVAKKFLSLGLKFNESSAGMIPNHPRGRSKRKLTADQVREIRERYKYGNAGELAKEFGVSRTTIGTIVRGETYKDVGNSL